MGALCITNAPTISSSSDTQQAICLDLVVNETTNTFARFDHLTERRYEGSNIVEGVIVGTSTIESDGGGVIFESDVLDCSAVGDSEVHDQNNK